jgi:hypothetical protein
VLQKECLLDGTSRRHFGNLDDNGGMAMAIEVWKSKSRREVAASSDSAISRASWSGAAHVIDITDELSHARVFTCGFGIPHLWFEARKTN